VFGRYFRCLGVVYLAAILSGPVVAEKPTVVDGDTVKIDGQRKRLRNHDAPETGASRGEHAPKCDRERQLGEASKARFKEIIDGGKNIEIKTVGRDKYHREAEAINAITYATKYHNEWSWRGALHIRKWRGTTH